MSNKDVKNVKEVKEVKEVKKVKAPKKVEIPEGYFTPKTLAEKLGTEAFKLRAFLRANFAGINGGKGKGYEISPELAAEIEAAWKTKPEKVKKEKKETTKAAKTNKTEKAVKAKPVAVEEEILGDLD